MFLYIKQPTFSLKLVLKVAITVALTFTKLGNDTLLYVKHLPNLRHVECLIAKSATFKGGST